MKTRKTSFPSRVTNVKYGIVAKSYPISGPCYRVTGRRLFADWLRRVLRTFGLAS